MRPGNGFARTDNVINCNTLSLVSPISSVPSHILPASVVSRSVSSSGTGLLKKIKALI